MMKYRLKKFDQTSLHERADTWIFERYMQLENERPYFRTAMDCRKAVYCTFALWQGVVYDGKCAAVPDASVRVESRQQDVDAQFLPHE